MLLIRLCRYYNIDHNQRSIQFCLFPTLFLSLSLACAGPATTKVANITACIRECC
ncbi:hypothetical protein BDV59DRAFT_186795, partial [Aspergillus ambiguus]|uniref:uncharacterized protein n=1 Tax=Aspergillus ambiguus TaxID=176160 RepID=UPI003CCE50BE